MTADKSLEIDTVRLQNDIDSLKTHLNQMKTKGESMMEGILALGQMWEGASKEAFTSQFQADYQILQAMEQVIDDLIRNLEFAKDQYESCEDGVESIINSIRI